MYDYLASAAEIAFLQLPETIPGCVLAGCWDLNFWSFYSTHIIAVASLIF